MATRRILGLLALAATFACGTEVTQFGGSGGSGGSGNASGTGGDVGGSGGNTGGGGSNVGGGDPCQCDLPAFVPVCGEDGTTYNAVCGEQCVPVPIACDGECPCQNDSCGELEALYATTLAAAKECSPMLPVEQCLTEVNDALACPCPTMANQGPATEELAKIQAQWDMLGCGASIDCPEIACPVPSGAQCLLDPNGMKGLCTDIFVMP